MAAKFDKGFQPSCPHTALRSPSEGEEGVLAASMRRWCRQGIRKKEILPDKLQLHLPPEHNHGSHG